MKKATVSDQTRRGAKPVLECDDYAIVRGVFSHDALSYLSVPILL